MLKGIKCLLFVFCFFCVGDLASQTVIGSQSNYAGSNAVSMNPASLTTSNLYFDVGFMGVGLSIYNDYAYIMGKDVLKTAMTMGDYIPTYNVDGRNRNYLTYKNPKHRPINLYESFDLGLFNMMFNIGDIQAVGLSLNMRAYTSATKIPWELPEAFLDSIGTTDIYDRDFSSKRSMLSTLEWAELALTYSTTIYERYNHKLDVGMSLKYLIGYSAAVAKVNKLNYEIPEQQSISINEFDFDAAAALPIDYDAPIESSNFIDKGLNRGSGLSVDLGFVYTRTQNKVIRRKTRDFHNYDWISFRTRVYYKWRVGFSLMDFGYIRFNNNAIVHHFYADSSMEFDAEGLENIETFNGLLEYVSESYYDGDSEKSLVGRNFVMGLPTTLRAQFDYNLYKSFYVNASIIQPIRLFKYSVMAAPRLMVEPRYESKYFDFALPVTLYKYKFWRLGASMRIGFLTIGTEKIANYLGLGKTNGMDFYMSLKFNLSKSDKAGNRYGACWSIF